MESSCFLILKSYAFLAYQAPLSDPIFGSEKAPEPKQEENYGIDMFLMLTSYVFLVPLSDLIFLAPKRLRSLNGRKIMESISFFVLKFYTFLAPLSDPNREEMHAKL